MLDFRKLLWYVIVLTGGATYENIINELWHGNIISQEDSRTNSPEMKELLGYMARHHEDLEKSFTDEQFGDINIVKAPTNLSNMVLRATAKGKPLYTDTIINGKKEKVVNVGGKSYMPNKSL